MLLSRVRCVCSVSVGEGVERVVSSSNDKTLRVWDVSDGGASVAVLEGHTGWVPDLSVVAGTPLNLVLWEVHWAGDT